MKLHRLALLTGIGSGLEYYSFITFALQAKIISILFFHNQNHALVNTFLIFAMGSVVTLIGGFLFGFFGDRLGRKKLLILSIFFMTISTVGIGLLPVNLPFKLSIILLMLCRFIQSASVGGEIPGAIVFVYEHSHKNQAGLLLGILFLGIGFGAGLSTAVNALVADLFTSQQVLSFAWRIPFLLAIFLGVPSYILRRTTMESPSFQAYLAQNAQQKQNKIVSLKSVLLGAGLVFFPAILVSTGLYLPSYWMDSSFHSNDQIFLAMMTGFLITALFLPVFGKIGDLVSQKNLYLLGVVLTLEGLPFLMLLLAKHTALNLYEFNLIYYFLIVIMAATYPAMLANLFPIQFRYRYVALSYSGTYAIAAIAPFIISLLMERWNTPNTLLFFLLLAGFISLISGCIYYRVNRVAPCQVNECGSKF